MLEQILISALIGATFGVVGGLAVAVLSRDGIWPNVWAGLILAGAILGVFLGLIA